jgi:hypothetical protein
MFLYCNVLFERIRAGLADKISCCNLRNCSIGQPARRVSSETLFAMKDDNIFLHSLRKAKGKRDFK